MNVRTTDRFTVADAAEIYGVDNWGNGYLEIGDNGHLRVLPTRTRGQAIDLPEVVADLARRDVRTPVLLRFPQIVESQVRSLAGAFQNAIEEYGYAGRYRPVFPIKVNHHRGVVAELVRSGWNQGLGLEVGSRPELLAALAVPAAPDGLLICNGYKDRDYLATAALATRLGRKVVVVLEKPFELDQYLEMAREQTHVPMVGVRFKLQSRGSGMWEKSGGYASKFGLSTLQLLRAVERLDEAGLADRFALLHFHIGSQITEIRKVKNAIREAARVYAKLRRMGVALQYVDVGGGLGIDYDGSKTSSDASVNYSSQEYANDIVFTVQEVCEEEHVPPPDLLSESGRHLVAYHSVLVTDVRAVIHGAEPVPAESEGEYSQVVEDLREIARLMGVKNYRELYHDALEYRDQLYSMFSLGMIDLRDRALGETLFWEIAARAVHFSGTAKFQAEEFQELEHRLHDKYILNFSVFQSLPDAWALDQLFPIMPIHRLNERPTVRATLVDITCDSDGEVDKFVDLKDIKDSLEVHPLREGEPYHVAFLLIGAYQDTMGDVHNLFGRVHEAEVLLDPEGKAVVRNVRRGDPARVTMGHFGYREDALVDSVRGMLRDRVAAGHLDQAEADQLLDEYRQRLTAYTYLR
jgi:arginine decarboxylase